MFYFIFFITPLACLVLYVDELFVRILKTVDFSIDFFYKYFALFMESSTYIVLCLILSSLQFESSLVYFSRDASASLGKQCSGAPTYLHHLSFQLLLPTFTFWATFLYYFHFGTRQTHIPHHPHNAPICLLNTLGFPAFLGVLCKCK